MSDEENPAPLPAPERKHMPPAEGELITSLSTQNTYTIGKQIGEGNFGVVYGCSDVWGNELAVKVLKPHGTYESVKVAAEAELTKLLTLRNPFITFVYEAFEYRDTFYIVTERCYCPATNLFQMKDFNGLIWLMPIARCLLQAIYYLHWNNYAHQDIHPGNVFMALVKDEVVKTQPGSIQFKLGDLGVAKLFTEITGENTRALWMIPPEIWDPNEYGKPDHRVDIYHLGLFFLQLAYSKELQFTKEEIVAGKPREMALALSAPYNFAIEKALRRHIQHRTGNAMELWRDLNSPVQGTVTPAESAS